MRRLLQEISVIPGVTGSCIFDKTAGALCSDFKSDLPVDLTESVGIHFVRLVQMGSMNNLNIKSAHFRFDRYRVVGLPLDTGAILLAICESDANCSLVATTAAMLAEDMRDEMSATGAEPAVQQKKKTSDDQSAGPGKQDFPASLKSQLEEIEGVLAEAIGPVAAMVMADYINKWSRQGPVDSSRLGELVTMLVEEVDDPGLVREFQSNLKHLH
ncbi:MAG: hypothetical protein M8357_11365 [Desulfobulbaceae bacterium]|nr:hypothetical protein [Desulfobulbaceae bacterium]